jgi:PAS domain S-box-containing protein
VIQIARAISRAKMVKELRTEITERKCVEEELSAAQKRLAFLAEASALLSSSLDYETTLKNVVRLAVPEIADWCTVDTIDEDGSLKRLAVTHIDPSKIDLAYEIEHRYPTHMDAPYGMLNVLTTSKPELYTEISDSLLVEVARDTEHLQILRNLGLKSGICVPLLARGQTLGMITFVMAESGRRYNLDDLAFAEDLARRAASAIDNARLYWSAQRAEERFSAFMRNLPVAAWIKDIEGHYVYANRIGEEIFHTKLSDLIDRTDEEIFPADTAKQFKENDRLVITRGESMQTIETLSQDDGIHHSIVSKFPIFDHNGNLVMVGGVAIDITEHKRMEEELLKAQKLESIGILAGGIAHDFNNLLTVILGNISLTKMLTDPEDKYKRLSEAEKACTRAIGLTQQLLTFSKGGAPVKRVISIEELIKDSATFAVSGSDVRCEFHIEDGLWNVEVDEGQIIQAINNVVINAEQAMPDGGVIRLKAQNISSSEFATHLYYKGDGLPLNGETYVKITIEDEGIGIPEDHLSKIFDPYFTTKQRGSGIGLTAAYSIIKNHDGYIAVESELGVGTKFYIYLPASDKQIVLKQSIEHRAVVGKGRILVMDDEEMIREVAGGMLNRIGYEVEFAREGKEAMELYRKAIESSRPFDLVIMDLTIPGGMGGKEAIKRLLDIDPQVKAIVSSGYSNDPVISEYKQYGFRAVVSKPYTIGDLAETLHEVINEK